MEGKLCAILMSTMLLSVFGYSWRDGDHRQVSWANDCDLNGNDFKRLNNTRSELCGLRCIEEAKCTHFAWAGIDGGTCFLKENRKTIIEIEATLTVMASGSARLCGFVNNRINNTNTNTNTNGNTNTNNGGSICLCPK